jgi:hypothetical protein
MWIGGLLSKGVVDRGRIIFVILSEAKDLGFDPFIGRDSSALPQNDTKRRCVIPAKPGIQEVIGFKQSWIPD